MDRRILDELTTQLSRLAPRAQAAGDDLRQSLDAAIRRALASMDVVTQEEFEQLQQALQRAEQRIAALESAVTALEQSQAGPAPHADAPAPAAADDKPSPAPDGSPSP